MTCRTKFIIIIFGILLNGRLCLSAWAPFFYNADPAFSFWDVLHLACQVDSGGIWVCSHQGCQRLKLTFGSPDGGYFEATATVKGIDLFECLIDGFQLPVGQMCGAWEVYLSAEFQKEWYLDNKEDVHCQVDFLV